jgi:hypothetical protein
MTSRIGHRVVVVTLFAVSLSTVCNAADTAGVADPAVATAGAAAPAAAPPALPAFSQKPALAELNDDLPDWLSLSGEFRYRFEGRGGLGFSEGNDDGYSLLRTRLNIGIKPTDWLQFFVQGQDSRAPGMREGRANGVFRDPLDIRQAYVKIGGSEGSPVALTAGRQLLIYGDQRLIGALDWTNTSRAFDALKLEIKPAKDVKFDVFSASVVQNDPSRQINQSRRGNNIHGVWGVVGNIIPKSTFEPYVLLRADPAVLGEGLRGDMDRYTGGFRLWAAGLAGWDYHLSFNKQWGHFGAGDIDAWAYYATLGHTFPSVAASPRVFAEYNFASGDDDPSDGRIGSFQDMYPTAHLWYGYNDLVGWRNIKNLRLGTQLKPHRKLKVGADYHSFWLANRRDALYTVGGGVGVRPPEGGAADSKVGDEIDLTLTIPVTKTTTLGGGVGHMFPGPFLKANSPGDSNTFVFLFAGYKF